MTALPRRRWWMLAALLLTTIALAAVLVPSGAAAAGGPSLTGTVYEPDGTTPAPGASVSVVIDGYGTASDQGSFVAETTTNASGEFSVTVPTASDDYGVTATLAGDVSAFAYDPYSELTSSPLTLTLGTAGFDGTVTDADSGAPVFGQTVDLDDVTTSSTVSTTADRNGYWAFPSDDFSSGDTYEIEYPASGLRTGVDGGGNPAYPDSFYGGSSAPASSGSATEFTAISTTPLDTALTDPAYGTVSGTISDGSGPLDGAKVELLDGDGEEIASTTASDTGSYIITGVTSGSYSIEAVPPDGIDDAVTYLGNTTSTASASYFSLTSPNQATGENVTAVTGAIISGQVTGTNGPVDGVSVSLTNAQGSPVVPEVATDSSGDYTFSGLLPGTYYLSFDPGNADTTLSANYVQAWYGAAPGSVASEAISSAAPISIGAGQSTTADESLPVGGGLTGLVTDARSGDGLEPHLEIIDSRGQEVRGNPNFASNGQWTVLGLPAGTYSVYVDGRGVRDVKTSSAVQDAQGWYGASGPVPAQPEATAFTIGGDTTTNAGTLALPAGASITGTVSAFGQPASDVSVLLYDAAGNLIAAPDGSPQTASDGTYDASGLLPGTYRVEFEPGDSSYEATDTETYSTSSANLAFQFYAGASTLSGATPVTVAGGQTSSAVNAALASGGAVSGTVTSAATGQPLPDVYVTVLDSSGDLLADTETSSDGSYVISGLPTGSYDLEFESEFGNQDFQTQYYSGAQVLANATPVAIVAGQLTSGISVALKGLAAAGQSTTATVLENSTSTVTVTEPASPTPSVAGSTPAIRGTAKVGDTLRAVPGLWSAGASLTYQWFASGRAIPGATAATLTLAAAQRGKTITVTVAGQQSGYYTVVKTSAATGSVAIGTLQASTPHISGVAEVGHTLRAVLGVWTHGTRFTYRWLAGAKAIRGATAATLTLAPAEAGQRITVVVTGRQNGYTAATRQSAATATVRAG